ncbi:MFS general substrate transporter [Clavulina sp. PMI_390]|nr:MFS general substrate transporter [Clavulina sp. PMI_390]
MSSDDIVEKGSLEEGKPLDALETSTPHAEIASILAKFSPEDERKLLWKIDVTLIPWLSLLFLLSFLDRSSIGNASLYGMRKDLHLTDQKYLWALSVFFFSYAAFEIPSNLVVRRLKPYFWFSFIMVAWGTVMVAQGLVHNSSGLLTVRWFLGATEAGLFPGINYYLSCWYKRRELGIRAAAFFSAATLSAAFGGLLAAALSNLHGVGGKPAWAWIFIIEGLITVVVGVASYWLVKDFPEHAKFLTEDERAFVIARLQADDQRTAGGDEKLSRRHVWAAVKDWKTWFGMLCFAGVMVPVYSHALFAPSIINQLGYKATAANLMSVPPAFLGFIACITTGYTADRTGRRGLYNVVLFSIAIVAYVILIASRNTKLSYFAFYLASLGTSSIIPDLSLTLYLYPCQWQITVSFYQPIRCGCFCAPWPRDNSLLIFEFSAWLSNNVEGPHKRAVSLAMMIGFANLNAPAMVNVYRAAYTPWYRPGHCVVVGYAVMGLVSSIVFIYKLDRENKARDAGLRDERILADLRGGKDTSSDSEIESKYSGGTYETVNEARKEKGDLWSGYRYIL